MTDALGTTLCGSYTVPTGEDESDYYPFGGEIVLCNRVPQNYKFTGKERDSESGLDYFGARHYTSALGRFMVPDWAPAPTDVPYANFGNPQSLNLYSYVQNNPITLGDPDGHCPACAAPVLVELSAAPLFLFAGIVAEVTTKPVEWYFESKRDEIFRQVSAENRQKLAQQAQKQQQQDDVEKEEEPEPQTSTDSGGARKRGGENSDAAFGRKKHEEFADKVKAKDGWKSQPSLKDPKTGKTVKPDAVSPSGKPVELKPDTASGRAAGQSQIKKYNRATGKKGRVVFYKKPS